MKKRLLMVVALVAMLVCAIPVSSFAAQSDDIVILYENDVHCEVSGYSALAAMKKELEQQYEHVGVVSSGDFLQGGSLGSISKGEYIVRLMNLVGYDAIALGNHEFDYGLDRLIELSDILDTKPICANFKKVGEGECFDPYSIKVYGDVKIAYVGITTPTTPDKTSFPSQFFDEDGNEKYTFSKNDLAAVVQENINDARAEGVDFVIALSHLGDNEEAYNASDVVSQVYGLDVVLDAHSHSVIESSTLTDKNGEKVVYSSTGSNFKNIGKLVISGDSITTELISLDNYDKTDATVDAYIEEILAEYTEIGNRKVAECEFDLITHDGDNRIVRVNETNLGNLIADAFRHEFDADISYFNGGGIRSDIKAGDITFNDILSVMPFNNTGVLVEVSGETIIKMLEKAMEKWPEENGNFPHVCGITFSVNTLGKPNNRVYNVKIENKDTGVYEPIALDKTYTVASNNFILLECGDGMDMFKGAKVLSDTGILDIEIFEKYITEHLKGVIDERYSEVNSHIRFTEGVITEEPYVTDGDHAVLIAAIGGILAFITIVTVIIIRKRR